MPIKGDTIYVVTEGEYSDYRIVAVFASLEEATAFCPDEALKDILQCYKIEPFVLGETKGKAVRKRWTIAISLKTGEIIQSRCGSQFDEVELGWRGKSWLVDYHRTAEACSHVSAEHAMKLAVEARQKWLRESRK